jgi:hypothetical protein
MATLSPVEDGAFMGALKDIKTGSPQSMSFTSRGIVIKKTLTPKKKSDTTHKS